ncbi:TPM domain-containing protein [Neisseria leonii]|uniref:TPM domain-containing protein n=1 Tax=Neisseria leonii TaxID=2995413 RepID=A0A9X4E296_9NEIS|nr:TPM domain-containing protein [Neisseria sp. 51.81]MDD9328250.1 TPM domain-containing protein [Neisseria sp. 51.81]
METNRFKRLWQHWLHPRARVAHHFPQAKLQRVAERIADSEARHLGQIRFVVESRYPTAAVLTGLQPRVRAWQWFGELGVWDTEHNSGVLVYVSFADHAVEIVADRGIGGKAADAEWQAACNVMLRAFRRGDYIEGLKLGLIEVDAILQRHLPCDGSARPDELPNEVVLR